MYKGCGLLVLALYLQTGAANRTSTCPARCRTCIRGQCFQCQHGYWGRTCEQKCGHNCRDNACSLTSFCSNGCLEGWYGMSCDKECSHCNPGGCAMSDGYCRNGCLPEVCHEQCPCASDNAPDSEGGQKRYETMDSIPNNLIVAFVIGVVFVVFIVFVFCGYTKCPEKGRECNGATACSNSNSNTRTRRTLNRTLNCSGTRRSDVAAYLNSAFPASHRMSYRSNVTAAAYDNRAAAYDTRAGADDSARISDNVHDEALTSESDSERNRTDLNLHLAFFPPPYGTLSPPKSPDNPKEEISPPPAYDSLFPPKHLPELS